MPLGFVMRCSEAVKRINEGSDLRSWIGHSGNLSYLIPTENGVSFHFKVARGTGAIEGKAELYHPSYG